MHSIQTNLYDFRGKMLNIKLYNEDANKTEAGSSIHSVVYSFQACFKWVQKRKGKY